MGLVGAGDAVYIEGQPRDRDQQPPVIGYNTVSTSYFETMRMSVVRGLEATNGYNPLRIGSYDRLVSPGETTHIVDQRLFPASFDGYDCALARELGLEYLVLGPVSDDPKQIDLMAKKVVKHFK